MLQWSFLLLFLVTIVTEARIFCCELADGSKIYQQLPCTKLAKQSLLPILPENVSDDSKVIEEQQLWLTILQKVNEFIKPNILHYTNNRLVTEPIQQAIIREYNRQVKMQQRRKHVDAINAAKMARRKQHCSQINTKIQLLQNRLRTGYTVKQEIKIKEQLLYYNKLQQKFCDK